MGGVSGALDHVTGQEALDDVIDDSGRDGGRRVERCPRERAHPAAPMPDVQDELAAVGSPLSGMCGLKVRDATLGASANDQKPIGTARARSPISRNRMLGVGDSGERTDVGVGLPHDRRVAVG